MKKYIVPAVTLFLVVSFALYGLTAATPAPATAPTVSVLALERTDLVNTVDVPGVVQSQNITKIYSSLAYPVFNLAVKVGDVVNEGDLLCQLDTEALELSIQQQSTAVSIAQQKANYNLAVAQKDLQTQEYNVRHEYDAGIKSAGTAVDNAKAAVENAKVNRSSASAALNAARRQLRDLREDDIYPPSYVAMQDMGMYDQIEALLRDAVIQAEQKLEAADIAAEQAEDALEKAQENTAAADMLAEEQHISANDRVVQAKLAANLSDQWIAVQKLKLDMEKAVVTAPVSGVVTAVNTSEGAPGSGLLFVIEDASKLEVVSNVDEYDIISVKPGSPVEIRPDADESVSLKGTVETIAPTPAKAPTGDNVTANTATYETKAAVDNNDGNLRIGMHVRMQVTTGRQTGVFAVPYSAVTKNAAGESVVFVALQNESGGYVVGEIPVKRGFESDSLVEISAGELKPGDLIITSVMGVHKGDRIAVDTL